MIRKVKNTALWAYEIEDLNGQDIVRTLHEKELNNTSQTLFRVYKSNKENR